MGAHRRAGDGGRPAHVAAWRARRRRAPTRRTGSRPARRSTGGSDPTATPSESPPASALTAASHDLAERSAPRRRRRSRSRPFRAGTRPGGVRLLRYATSDGSALRRIGGHGRPCRCGPATTRRSRVRSSARTPTCPPEVRRRRMQTAGFADELVGLRPAAPSLVATAAGSMAKVLLTIPSYAVQGGAANPYGAVYRDLLAKLPAETELVILTHEGVADDVRALARARRACARARRSSRPTTSSASRCGRRTRTSSSRDAGGRSGVRRAGGVPALRRRARRRPGRLGGGALAVPGAAAPTGRQRPRRRRLLLRRDRLPAADVRGGHPRGADAGRAGRRAARRLPPLPRCAADVRRGGHDAAGPGCRATRVPAGRRDVGRGASTRATSPARASRSSTSTCSCRSRGAARTAATACSSATRATPRS